MGLSTPRTAEFWKSLKKADLAAGDLPETNPEQGKLKKKKPKLYVVRAKSSRIGLEAQLNGYAAAGARIVGLTKVDGVEHIVVEA